jgi:hypothetical protein
MMTGSLVLQIGIGIIAGVALSLISPDAAKASMLLGNLFVQALKAVAPVLVLVLVASAIANRRSSHTAQMRPIVLMYLIGTIAAALLAVTMSSLFPTTLALQTTDVDAAAPQGITEVLGGLLLKLFDNPINAILTGNFIGILVWGVLLGIFLHHAAESTRNMLADTADAVTHIVRLVIRLAPIGIFGLVADAQEPLPDSTDGAPGKRRHCFFYAQFGGKHSCQSRVVRAARPGKGHVCGLYSARRYNQHGWGGNYDHGVDAGRRAHPGHRRRPAHGVVAQCCRSVVSLWGIRCCRRVAAIDSTQLRTVRHIQRHRDAGRRCRIRYQYPARLGRDRVEARPLGRAPTAYAFGSVTPV